MLEERKKRRSRVQKADAYEVPDELVKAEEPGPLLKHCLMHCYGSVGRYQEALNDKFHIARQTVYKWVNHGVPFDRREDFEEFAADKKTVFALPTNAPLDAFLRPERSRYEAASGEQNPYLLDFLMGCVQREGPHSIEIMANAMRNVKSPHLFFKWAYNDSGVPVTYIEDFLAQALHQSLYETMEDEKLRDPERFAAYVRARMCVDPSYAPEFYGVASG